MGDTKSCSHCKVTKPLTDYHKDKTRADGRDHKCKVCKLDAQRRRLADPDYAEKRKSIHRKSSKKYYDENRVVVLENKRTSEKTKERVKRYRLMNKGKISVYFKRYRVENPDVILKRDQKRRHIERGLIADFTEDEWKACKGHFNNQCAYCGASDVQLTQEHIVPVIKGGGYTKSNIIPACRTCNSSKRSSDMLPWLQKQSFYDEKRVHAIQRYVGDQHEVKQ